MEEKKSNNKLLLEVKNEIRDITNDVFIIRNELKCIKDLIDIRNKEREQVVVLNPTEKELYISKGWFW
tara:strand:+ start:134 stop:337 length:204 start_codon:yes stop_codon:yes gene_type:complete